MVRASRIALVLGFVVLAAASSTAAGASGSPVVEAGGAHPVPDPRWLELASTYDAACSASDADPAKYVQCIAMHVDASVSAPAHATDATCVLASLVTDDALGLANCRFVAQHLGRTAFDAVAAGASPAEAETAARDAFRACHASFCDGGCAQGVLVGMPCGRRGPGFEPGRQLRRGGRVPRVRFAPGVSTRATSVSAAAYAADAADAPSPVNCAAGIGRGLFAASVELRVSVPDVAVVTRRRGGGPGGGRGGGGRRLHRACVSGALLRNALAKVTRLALDANATADEVGGSAAAALAGEDNGGEAGRPAADTSPTGRTNGLDAVCAPFAPPAEDGEVSAETTRLCAR